MSAYQGQLFSESLVGVWWIYEFEGVRHTTRWHLTPPLEARPMSAPRTLCGLFVPPDSIRQDHFPTDGLCATCRVVRRARAFPKTRKRKPRNYPLTPKVK